MLRFLLCALLISLSVSTTVGQSAKTPANIPVVDMRDYTTKKAIWEAVQNTKQNAVVVLIRGGDDALFNAVKSKLKAMAHQGYNRVGIVRSKTSPGEVGASLGVFADGTIYASIKDAKPSTYHTFSLFNLVRDAYDEFVIPNLSGGGQ